MSAARLTALEELTAHQAKIIEELSEEVARQAKALAMVELKLARLNDRFMALGDTPPAENKRPPHW